MGSNSLALQIIQPDTNLEEIYIGTSRFTDDTWDLRPLMPSKTLDYGHKHIEFGYIKSPRLKHVVKQYAYYRLGKIKPVTVKNEINGCLPSVISFLESNGVESFSQVTEDLILRFSKWLREDKKVAYATGCSVSRIFESIIKVGQIKGWDVPKNNVFLRFNTKTLWSQKERKGAKTKPIPEHVFNQIMYNAVHTEKDPVIKAGIIIQSQTGLRISEVLSIKEGCLHTTYIDGQPYDYMEVYISKTVKGEPQLHKVFINEITKSAIIELSNATKKYREELGIKELFIYKGYCHNPGVQTAQNWTAKKLPAFCERWDIRDKDGEIYPLKSHQFRATFVRELIKQKVPIAMIMKQYAHVSVEMTAHYLTLQEEEIKEIYSDMILSPESKIAGLRAKEIRKKLDDLFHGKTREEIDEVISGLTKSMSFNPLPTGVCLYDFRRGNCSEGDGCFMYNCPNYITEVQFYPILKNELDLLEKEMARLRELGQEREWQRQYVKHKYLRPLVNDLEAQLNEKENS